MKTESYSLQQQGKPQKQNKNKENARELTEIKRKLAVEMGVFFTSAKYVCFPQHQLGGKQFN